MNSPELIIELKKFPHFLPNEVDEMLAVAKKFDENDEENLLDIVRTTVLKNCSDYSPSQIIYSMLYNMDAIESSDSESECFERLFSESEMKDTISILDKIIPDEQLGTLSAVLSVEGHSTGHSFIRNMIKWIWSEKRDIHDEFIASFEDQHEVYLKLSHACLRLWKRKRYDPRYSPLLYKEDILDVVNRLTPNESKLGSYILDRIIINKLWALHASQVDRISWDDLSKCLRKLVEIEFDDDKVNFYVRMSAFHFAYHDEERETKLSSLLDQKGDDIGNFEIGMVHYLLASRMKISDERRLDNFATSLQLMDGIDKHRQNRILKRIMLGQVDNLKPGKIEPDSEKKGHIERVNNVIRFTTTSKIIQDSTTKLLLDEAKLYLEYIVSTHRQQCGDCNAIHPERESTELDLNKVDQLLATAKENNLEKIQDICHYINIVTKEKTIPNEYIKNGLVELIRNEKEDPNSHVFDIYKIQSCKEEDVFGRFFGLAIHISCKYFTLKESENMLIQLKEIIELRMKDCKNTYRFEYILQMIDQLEEKQPGAWKESIYSMLSNDIEKWISLETCPVKMVPLVMDVFRLFYFNRVHHSKLYGTEFGVDLAIITKSLRTVQNNPDKLQPLSKRQVQMVEWWDEAVQHFIDLKDRMGDDYGEFLHERRTTIEQLDEAKVLLSSENWIGD